MAHGVPPTLHAVFPLVSPSSAHSSLKTVDDQTLVLSRTNTDPKGRYEPAPFPPEPLRASHLRLHLQAGARTISLEMRLCLYCPHRCGQFPPEPPAGPGGSHRHGLSQSAVQLGLAPDNLSCPKALLDFAEAEVSLLGLSWLQQAALSLVWAPGYLPACLPFWCPPGPLQASEEWSRAPAWTPTH